MKTNFTKIAAVALVSLSALTAAFAPSTASAAQGDQGRALNRQESEIMVRVTQDRSKGIFKPAESYTSRPYLLAYIKATETGNTSKSMLLSYGVTMPYRKEPAVRAMQNAMADEQLAAAKAKSRAIGAPTFNFE